MNELAGPHPQRPKASLGHADARSFEIEGRLSRAAAVLEWFRCGGTWA